MAVPESTVLQPVVSQSVAALCERFLDSVEIHRAFATFENYRYRLQRFVDRYPDLAVDDLRPFHVQEWADSYVFSQNPRRNYMRSIKTCLRWCCKQGYVDTNPLEYLTLPAQKHRDVYVPPEEFERLLQFVCGDALRDLIIVTYDVGCRPQECLRVERRHVEPECQRWVFPPAEAKGRSAPPHCLSDGARDGDHRTSKNVS